MKTWRQLVWHPKGGSRCVDSVRLVQQDSTGVLFSVRAHSARARLSCAPTRSRSFLSCSTEHSLASLSGEGFTWLSAAVSGRRFSGQLVKIAARRCVVGGVGVRRCGSARHQRSAARLSGSCYRVRAAGHGVVATAERMPQRRGQGRGGSRRPAEDPGTGPMAVGGSQSQIAAKFRQSKTLLR